MRDRAKALAGQFEQAVDDLAKTIEQMPEAQWRAKCNDEGWSVAATAQHVAGQFYPIEHEYISAVAEGKEMPSYSWDDINGKNEQRAAKFGSASKEEVLKTLRDDGSKIAAYVRGLSDEQLDRTAPLALAGGAQVSTQQLIEGGVLIDHVNGHLKSIRAAG